MTWPPDRPEWPALEQDFGTVKVVPADEQVRRAVEGPLRADLDLPPVQDLVHSMSQANQARLGILEVANDHATRALEEMREAVSWFGVVDRSDHADLLRQVEALAETIAYRLRNAR